MRAVKASRLLRDRTMHRVIVSTKTGAAFSGVLHAVDAQAWILREAEALGVDAAGANIVVDGEVVILAADVAHAQILGG